MSAFFNEGKVDADAAGAAFKSQYATLMLVIPDSFMLAGHLYSKGLVSRTLLSKLAIPGLSSYEKNILILNEIEEQIPSNPSVFNSFVTVLLSIEQLREMGENLIMSYSKYIANLMLEV